MVYSLLSSSGNMIDWFSDESEARAALQRIVDREPECVAEVALFVNDDAGKIVRGPIHAAPSAVC